MSSADLAKIQSKQPSLAKRAVDAVVRSASELKAEQLAVRVVSTDEFGITQVRIQQEHDGVPVWGSTWIAHVDEGGTTSRLIGRDRNHPKLKDVSAKPSIDAQTALEIVKKDLSPSVPSRAMTPRLVIVPQVVRVEVSSAMEDPERIVGYDLVYRVPAPVRSEKEFHDYLYEIDAHTGKVLSRVDVLERMGDINIDFSPPPPNAHTQYSGDVWIPTTKEGSEWVLKDPGRGGTHPVETNWTGGNAVFDVEGEEPDSIGWGYDFTDHDDNVWGNGQNYTSDDLASGTQTDHGQTAATDVYYATMVTWDLLDKVFGRKGVDAVGSALLSNVHGMHAQGHWAYWSHFYESVYVWDPTPPGKQPTTIDIIGHEFGHGLFLHAVGLGVPPAPFSGEFGGLNEANSDILGTLVEFYASSFPYSGSVIPSTGGDWVLAEDMGEPVRYLYKPSLNDEAYDEWFPGIDDPAQDAHDTSGPLDRMFYFLSEGAVAASLDPERSSPHLPDGFSGIGIDSAGRIWMRAITSYVTIGMKFRDVREACLLAATDLFGKYSNEYQTVMDAFAAVNVGPPADRWGPEISISVERTPTQAKIHVTITDDSDIQDVGYSMSGENEEGVGVGFGAALGPTNGFTESFFWNEVDGYLMRLKVTATDANGKTSTKTKWVDFWNPSIHSINFSGSTLKHHVGTVRATDNPGFGRAELYLDDVLVDSVVSPPSLPPIDVCLGSCTVPFPEPVEEYFTLEADLSNLPTGIHGLRYVVYDSSGNQDSHVTDDYVDNTPPVVVPGVYPIIGGQNSYHGIVALAATVQDTAPSVVTDFYVDGDFICQDHGHTPRCNGFDTEDLADGPHELRAYSVDGVWGNEGSGVFNFVVDNTTMPDEPDDPPPAWFYESENNGTLNSADLVPNNAIGIKGASANGQDVDIFRFSVPPGDRLRMTFESLDDTLLCFWWGIYDSSFQTSIDEQVQIPELGGEWGYQVVNGTGSTKNYYIRVMPRTDVCYGPWGDYQMRTWVD